MSNFGIDLLLESQKLNIKSRNDVLVILMHWLLCKNELKNVGIGDNKIYSEDDRQSELLPEGWNLDETAYTLRYTINKEIYIFHASVIGKTILFNLLDVKDLTTAGLVLDTNEIVIATTGRTVDDFIKDSSSVIKKMTEELVDPVLKKKKTQDTATSTQSPLVQPALPRTPLYSSGLIDDRRDILWDVGRGDLDPLGRGGGMIFDPRHPFRPSFGGPQGLFPQRFPPGARFDPPNPLNRFDPDNDHLPPPGRGGGPPGYDDMFM